MISNELVDLFLEVWKEKEGHAPSKRKINYGWCYQFALVLYRVYGGELWSAEDDHAWIKVDGKHYDSEHLTGVVDPKKLSYCKPRIIGEKEFIEFWNDGGGSGKVRLEIIEEVVSRWKWKQDYEGVA